MEGLALMVDPAFWAGKRVFLTGHTGFKGGWLALWLQSMGAVVKGFALVPDTTPDLFGVARVGEEMTCEIGDIRDLATLAASMTAFDPEIVFHMAAQPLVQLSYRDPVGTYATNVMGTVHVLEAARRVAALRAVVVVTTDKCYENREWPWGYRESEAMGGHDPYSSSKGCAELATSAYRRSFFVDPAGPAIASARAGNVVGGGDWAENRLIPDILRSFDAGEAVPIRNPLSTRPWQHVLEPLSGYLLLGHKLFEEGHAHADGWNFGPRDEDARPVEWIVERMIEKWGEGARWQRDAAFHPHEARFLKLDISKAQEALGWAPRWSLDTALDRIVAWHKAWAAGDDMRALCLAQIDEYLASSPPPPRRSVEQLIGNRSMIADRPNDDAATATEATTPACQYCATPLSISWIDLGRQPLSNDYGSSRDAARAAAQYPLHARACPECWLVQVDRVVPPEDIFSDYAYFSSYSESWLAHCRDYAAAMVERFGLTRDDLVVEVASNDGYQLKYFAESGIGVLGIDPAANVAKVATDAGIPTEVDFFGADLARRLTGRGVGADHLSAKNVMAHVPDIGDFAEGVAILLKPEAVFTVEFPHLLETMQRMQFDQIYHEHFTYLSLVAVRRIFADKGMRVFDVEQVETHGGSLRVFICHDAAGHPTSAAVERVLDREVAAGLDRAEGYAGYNDRVARIRRDFLDLLATARAQGKAVAGYGAAAKGNTFLNYCAAEPGTLAFIADRSPAKAGRFMPGSGIAILTPDAIDAQRPDYLIILPWNLSDEIAGQMARIRDWGGRFVTAIPEVRIF